MGGKFTTLNGDEIDYSGRPAKVKNMGGVLATLHNHDHFVDKLKNTLVTVKWWMPADLPTCLDQNNQNSGVFIPVILNLLLYLF